MSQLDRIAELERSIRNHIEDKKVYVGFWKQEQCEHKRLGERVVELERQLAEESKRADDNWTALDRIRTKYSDEVNAHKEAKRQLAAKDDALKVAENALRKHHQWHNEIGVVIFPGDAAGDEQCEVDLTDAYADSCMCGETLESLAKIQKLGGRSTGEHGLLQMQNADH